MNVRRLREVRALVLAKPERFDMDDFTERTDCGTTCCIGGHAAFLAGFIRNPRKDEDDDDMSGAVVTRKGKRVNESLAWGGEYTWEPIYRESLKLTVEQSERLFSTAEWPKRFECEYRDATDSHTRAKVAAKRITHFIKTKGRE